MILCSAAAIILAFLESDFSLKEIIFEVSSAFGTVGLSLGITPELSTGGKVVIMILMFIGKIGMFTFLSLWEENQINIPITIQKSELL